MAFAEIKENRAMFELLAEEQFAFLFFGMKTVYLWDILPILRKMVKSCQCDQKLNMLMPLVLQCCDRKDRV